MKKFLLAILIANYTISEAQVHTFKESIYFGLGKTSLTREHKAKLDSIIIVLKSSKTYSGEIKGYTCTIGSISINKMISNLRALNVYNYLIDKGAIKDNFTYLGLATANPQGSNRTASGRTKNRRADIELLLNLLDETTANTSSSSEPIKSEYSGFRKDPKNGNNSSNTTTNTNTAKSDAEIANAANSNATELTSEKMVAAVELGPEFSSGKIAAATNIRVKSTNGIVWEMDKNTFITSSKEPIEADFKDYTRNGEIIRKGLQTKVGQNDYKMLGAFSVSFSQEYQDIALNSGKPLKVYIPGPKDDAVALYSNHKNWTRDTINRLTYDDYRQAYVVSVINNSQMIALMRPIPDPSDTLRYVCIKIKGLSADLIKPYIIFDDCSISNGYRLKGKKFIFPITKSSSLYRLRAAYIDYSSKNSEPYSLNYDLLNTEPTGKADNIEGKQIITLKNPKKIDMKREKLPVSSLCEMNSSVGN